MSVVANKIENPVDDNTVNMTVSPNHIPGREANGVRSLPPESRVISSNWQYTTNNNSDRTWTENKK